MDSKTDKFDKSLENVYNSRFGDYRNILVDEYENKFPFLVEQVGTDYCQEKYVIDRINSPLSVIGCTIQGTGQIIEDGEVYTVKKDEFFILKNGHTHQYHPLNNWAFKWINICGDFESILKLNGIEDVVVFSCPMLLDKFAETIANAIYADNGIEIAQVEVQSFINSMIPFIKLSTIRDFKKDLSLEEKIKAALESDCFNDYSFEAICNQLGVTPRHAQRLFKTKFNITPHNYVLQLRYKQACSLLMMPNLSIKYISMSVGFNDSKYFSTFFKACSGYSPQAYRKFIKR